MAAVTSALIGAAGLAATGVGMAQQQSAADYNEKLAVLEGQQQEKAMDAEARRLSESQRELKASQRVALAAGGAGSGQEQPLMLLADQANKMQLDQIELSRRGDIARSKGKSRSLLAKMQGQEALIGGVSDIARQGYGLYKGYKGTRST